MSDIVEIDPSVLRAGGHSAHADPKCGAHDRVARAERESVRPRNPAPGLQRIECPKRSLRGDLRLPSAIDRRGLARIEDELVHIAHGILAPLKLRTTLHMLA